MVELPKQNRKAGHLFAMKIITQAMRFRQAVIEYSDQHSVTKAAIRYRLKRQYIYRWRKRGQMAAPLPNPKYVPKPYEFYKFQDI